LESLDITIKHRIQSCLARVAIGNLGEYKLLGDHIHGVMTELKFKFGSGYRIYYSELDDVILLLLCAGDKKTQSKDIKMAKDYLEGESHG
jgi:putative addiction module killer protein